VRSTGNSALIRLANLPARMDDETLANVDAFGRSSPPALKITDRDHLLEFMRLMSDMPRKSADEATGKVKIENMQRLLGHLPRITLDWLLDEAHRRFTFYPSIHQLLDLAQEWTRTDEAVQARMIAARKVRDERDARLTETRRKLRSERCDQAWIDRLGARVAKIMETEGLLHRCADCGSYSQRGQWRHWAASQADVGSIDELREQLASNFPNSPKREAMEA